MPRRMRRQDSGPTGYRAKYTTLLDFTERDVSMGKVNIKTLAESDQELASDDPLNLSRVT
jgi:hypothetical protein